MLIHHSNGEMAPSINELMFLLNLNGSTSTKWFSTIYKIEVNFYEITPNLIEMPPTFTKWYKPISYEKTQANPLRNDTKA